MRRPLRLQLMLPVLAVVIVAIVACSVVSAYMAADWTRGRQEENLARVVATLTDASFPLNASVLRRMSGLSGAEFVVFDADGHFEAGSRPFSRAELAELLGLPRDQKLADFAGSKTVELAGRRYMANRLQVANAPAANGDPMSLAVAYPEERWTIARRQAVYPPLIVGAVAILLAVAVTALLARRLVHPLDALRRQAAAIEHGDFRSMPLSRRNDEIQDLAISINHMVERLARYEADVRQNERLRTLGQLGAGIAHQMRNAATGAAGARPASASLSAGARLRGFAGGAAPIHVDGKLFAAVPHAGPARIGGPRAIGFGDTRGRDAAISAAKLQSRPNRPAIHSSGGARLDFRRRAGHRPIANQLAVERHRSRQRHPRRRRRPPAPSPSGRGPPCHGTPNGGEGSLPQDSSRFIGLVRISIDRDATHRVLCRISDSGSGPSPEIGAKLFEPFATDKADGTGLGLAVVQQIATEHDAELSWHREGGLTQFVVAFPPRS